MAELFMESSSNSSSSPQDPGGGKSLITQRPAGHKRQTDVDESGEEARGGSGGPSDSPTDGAARFGDTIHRLSSSNSSLCCHLLSPASCQGSSHLTSSGLPSTMPTMLLPRNRSHYCKPSGHPAKSGSKHRATLQPQILTAFSPWHSPLLPG